jgi:hypothetical protein
MPRRSIREANAVHARSIPFAGRFRLCLRCAVTIWHVFRNILYTRQAENALDQPESA